MQAFYSHPPLVCSESFWRKNGVKRSREKTKMTIVSSIETLNGLL